MEEMTAMFTENLYLTIIISVYLLSVSFYSVIITCTDKRCAKKGKRRIPEKQLFGAALLGGSAAMYITMRVIRHKTLHKRFMIGLPLIMLLQAAIVICLYCLFR